MKYVNAKHIILALLKGGKIEDIEAKQDRITFVFDKYAITIKNCLLTDGLNKTGFFLATLQRRENGKVLNSLGSCYVKLNDFEQLL